MNRDYAKKRTARRPMIVDGVTFLCFQTGINRFTVFSEDARARVNRNIYRSGATYTASVDGKEIGRLFRSEKSAMAAAAKAMAAAGAA